MLLLSILDQFQFYILAKHSSDKANSFKGYRIYDCRVYDYRIYLQKISFLTMRYRQIVDI